MSGIAVYNPNMKSSNRIMVNSNLMNLSDTEETQNLKEYIKKKKHIKELILKHQLKSLKQKSIYNNIDKSQVYSSQRSGTDYILPDKYSNDSWNNSLDQSYNFKKKNASEMFHRRSKTEVYDISPQKSTRSSRYNQMIDKDLEKLEKGDSFFESIANQPRKKSSFNKNTLIDLKKTYNGSKHLKTPFD